jgi:hypothetical protein
MRDAVDLTEFARYGKLDAYELTDDELARLLELWRWTAWMHRNTPSGPDHDILDEAHRLQRQLARDYNMEMEYNTALLLKQELEPLMHLRVLLDLPRALRYFLRPRGMLALIRGLRQARRYRNIIPVRDRERGGVGYPRLRLEKYRGHPPDLLKRRYWRQLSPYSFEERKKMDYWW